MIQVHVNGVLGRMGSTCLAAVQEAEDMALCGQSDVGEVLGALLAKNGAEVMVDFTVPDAVEAGVRTALDSGCHVVCVLSEAA